MNIGLSTSQKHNQLPRAVGQAVGGALTVIILKEEEILQLCRSPSQESPEVGILWQDL